MYRVDCAGGQAVLKLNKNEREVIVTNLNLCLGQELQVCERCPSVG